MTPRETSGVAVVDDGTLRRVVEGVLTDRAGAPRHIMQFRRSPSLFSSSYAIEELDLTLDDGACLTLVFKNLGQQGLTAEARDHKPGFLFDPRREVEVYNFLLPRYAKGSAVCIGSVMDEHRGRYWLFLEKVPGVELYQVGDFDIWLRAVRWLARFHGAAPHLPDVAESFPFLVRHDRSYYQAWSGRAQSNFHSRQAREREKLAWLLDRYEQVIDRLVALPRTLLHGDFNASNILVRDRGRPSDARGAGPSERICPVDWEMAAVGPGFTDLAALVSGGWHEEQRLALINAYLDAQPGHQNTARDRREVLNEVRFCQLQLAVQWLGWSPGWSPPAEHRQDWLGEALNLARQLEL